MDNYIDRRREEEEKTFAGNRRLYVPPNVQLCNFFLSSFPLWGYNRGGTVAKGEMYMEHVSSRKTRDKRYICKILVCQKWGFSFLAQFHRKVGNTWPVELENC